MAGKKGRSGRPRLPSAVKKMRGTYAKSRAAPNELQFKVSALEPPDYLDDVAAQEWRRLYPLLEEVKILTEPDLHQLGQYCEAFSLCLSARAEYRADGLTVVSELTGTMKPHPMIAVAEKASRTMLAFAVEFGLTPASRSRVQGQPPKKSGADDDDGEDAFHPPKLELVK